MALSKEFTHSFLFFLSIQHFRSFSFSPYYFVLRKFLSFFSFFFFLIRFLFSFFLFFFLFSFFLFSFFLFLISFISFLIHFPLLNTSKSVFFLSFFLSFFLLTIKKQIIHVCFSGLFKRKFMSSPFGGFDAIFRPILSTYSFYSNPLFFFHVSSSSFISFPLFPDLIPPLKNRAHFIPSKSF
ncbi:unnamed protein product [Acanthosepion pharaonis]|uniref:Uncharacterized protein n=1 Tax=Acanthosepion pharaonis TaxID=158019 RepID=A0A812CAL4_ACAPH|nr:unnamed protein product [Sepia pharaonis]